MNILALDLGTRFGFAILFNGRFLSGTKQLSKAFGQRFAEFQKWLKDTIYKYQISEVCFERVRRHIGTDAAHVYGGFMCLMSAVCHELGVLCRGFEVSAIKKNMTGNGRATKSMVVKAARLLGFNPNDDNEADAIAILFCRLKSPSKKMGHGIVDDALRVLPALWNERIPDLPCFATARPFLEDDSSVCETKLKEA